MGVNSLPKTVIRQRRGCDLNPGPSAPESRRRDAEDVQAQAMCLFASTLTTRLPSDPCQCRCTKRPSIARVSLSCSSHQCCTESLDDPSPANQSSAAVSRAASPRDSLICLRSMRLRDTSTSISPRSAGELCRLDKTPVRAKPISHRRVCVCVCRKL